ncbi:hypothetical protein [Aneurinibacillus migulanus]|uniref:Uncharacterized protein n=3 Tax=Aneurinibacillus migulanus TaxID=47500 RepID=A0A1G9D258_ANEMI|nr:hypothetical protein [Aneurinibacillus migulanus]MED0894136.1 hypothetical protein [Aneurinibacillus migulanus]MED1619863.1 hypothetical protein [Aneurinibacillus migulanus]SDK58012.1 hypothetical protein SAMN04487909_1762 [Aneurinibacillus migulanus]
MKQSTIRFQSFPRTEPPKDFIFSVVEVFKKHEEKISTFFLLKGLQSDEVLRMLSSDLIELGWEIETNKKKKDKIERPVFFGEGVKLSMPFSNSRFSPKSNSLFSTF